MFTTLSQKTITRCAMEMCYIEWWLMKGEKTLFKRIKCAAYKHWQLQPMVYPQHFVSLPKAYWRISGSFFSKPELEKSPSRSQRKNINNSQLNDDDGSPVIKSSKKRRLLVHSDEEDDGDKAEHKESNEGNSKSYFETEGKPETSKKAIRTYSRKNKPNVKLIKQELDTSEDDDDICDGKTKESSPQPSEVQQNFTKAGSSVTKRKPSTMNDFFAPKQKNVASKSKEQVTTGTAKGPKSAELSQAETYNPNCDKYHPINNATWKKDEKVPYLALAKTLEAIENVSARLKMVEILANFFRSVIILTPDDLLPCIYLCLNKLAPAYEGLELGVGETVLIKAISQTTGRSIDSVKAEHVDKGDLGIVAEMCRSNQRTMFTPARLTVRAVYEKLRDVAHMTGHASMAKKIERIQGMLVACIQPEARYLIRSLGGKLRIGLAEQSVLAALAQAVTLTPPGQGYPPEILDASKKQSSDSYRKELEANTLVLKTTYCECPSYDKIIPVLLNDGIKILPEKCKITPGVPIKPMLAHPTKGVEEVLQRFENAKFTCEYKYDGERAQIHLLEGGDVHVYSRNQEDNTTKYPDILARLPKSMKSDVKSCILDAEAVAWNRESKHILPFQVLSTRKRKDASEDTIKVQVCVFVFDLLYLNGESLVMKSYEARRSLLRSHFEEVENEFMFVSAMDSNNLDDIGIFLEEAVKSKCEGLMVKTLDVDATYEIAKRSRNWLKLKKDYLEGVGDTLDLVVIGGYCGKGKRAGNYGGFLLACYDPDNEEFQTICKLGTGFKDEDLAQHSSFFKQHVIQKPKPYYCFDSSHEPDEWFDAIQVWEVKCADLSISPVHKAAVGLVDPKRGISLRFPRFVRVREDKNPEDATTASQVIGFYKNQENVKSQQKGSNVNGADEEDFY